MRKILCLLVAIILLTFIHVGGKDEVNAAITLQQEGYILNEWVNRVDLCGPEFWFRTGFSATNASGKYVTGVVCRDFMGRSLIKTDW